MSASAPAGIANRQIGRLAAACTSATIKGSGLSEVISQPDAALYIQPPTFDNSVAVQITVNAEWRNGAANDIGRSALSAAPPGISLAYAPASGRSRRLRKAPPAPR